MSAVSYRLEPEQAGQDQLEIRVDDGFPAWERPVVVHLGLGFRSLTAEQAVDLGCALLEAAQEARLHQAECEMRPKPERAP